MANKNAARAAAVVLLSFAACAGGAQETAALSSRGEEQPVLLASLDTAGAIHTSTSADLDRRKLVRDAFLTFEVKDEHEQHDIVSRSTDIAASYGGYVASEHASGLVIRAPSRHVEVIMRDLEKLGHVKSRSISVREVTAQHTDLSIRIDNLRRLQVRLATLLKETKNVTEVLEVEKELARVTQELEQLEGQMRLLESQVALATITIDFDRTVRPGPVGWVFYGLYRGIKWLFVWD